MKTACDLCHREARDVGRLMLTRIGFNSNTGTVLHLCKECRKKAEGRYK